MAALSRAARARDERGHQPDPYRRQPRAHRHHRSPGSARRPLGHENRRGRSVKSPARLRVGIWLGFVLACAIIVARSQYGADLAAFLPSSPSPTQRFLVGELHEGVVSRLILIGIEGRGQDELAALSRSLAGRQPKNQRFAYVANGEPGGLRSHAEFPPPNRQLLSPAVTAQRFTAAGIRHGLELQPGLLSSPASLLGG